MVEPPMEVWCYRIPNSFEAREFHLEINVIDRISMPMLQQNFILWPINVSHCSLAVAGVTASGILILIYCHG